MLGLLNQTYFREGLQLLARDFSRHPDLLGILLDASASSGSSSSDSSQNSNFGQLGFAVGSNGVDIDIGIGVGLAIDLNTGGLATNFGSGSIGVDLTGSNSVASWSDTGSNYSSGPDYGSGSSPF
jgi:hypothetical protein